MEGPGLEPIFYKTLAPPGIAQCPLPPLSDTPLPIQPPGDTVLCSSGSPGLGTWGERGVCAVMSPPSLARVGPSFPALSHSDQDSPPLLEQSYLGPLFTCHPSCPSDLGWPSQGPRRILFASNSQATSRSITHLIPIIHLFSRFRGRQEALGTLE